MRKRYIMAERGNTTHGARLDDKMKQSIDQGNRDGGTQ